MKLNRSFFSLYFWVITLFIVFSWLLDEVWSVYLEQDIESYTGYKTMLTAIGDYVQSFPEAQWEEIVTTAGKRYNLPLVITSEAEFKSNTDSNSEKKSNKNDTHKHLQQNDTHIYYTKEQVLIHRVLGQSGKLLSLGPVQMPTRPRAEALVRVVILGTFGLIIFIWLWPVSKDLDKLKKAAGEFGQGNFNATVGEAKSSMMSGMIASFNMMANRIKRLIDSHKELTNAVSHELRTPLARSKFALQMLESTQDETKKAKYIGQVNSDIHELEELINEMLIYASFESDKPSLDFALWDINEVLTEQIANFNQFDGKLEFENKTLINKPARPILVECDRHFIDRALNNFITNAVKYGKGHIKISLFLQTTAKGVKHCNICVEDNGDGISDDFKKVIFDAFSRGDQSRNRETGGFGLGLAIVARIMEWHNGTASISDSQLGGAAFTLSFPIRAGTSVAKK